MDTELELLLGTAIDSLAKLHLLLYLHHEPRVLTPEAAARGVGRSPDLVGRALAQLAEAGLVTRFAVGRGRAVLYSASEDTHVQTVVGRLHGYYQESPEHRAEVVRKVLRTDADEAPGQEV